MSRSLEREPPSVARKPCVQCGEIKPLTEFTRDKFLTIDHVRGGGNVHRREVGGGGATLYEWLRRQGFPREGYRLLCFNCNIARGLFGSCPHEVNVLNRVWQRA